MNINYLFIAGIVFILLVLLVLFLRRNKKDEKEFEKEINQEELEPEKYKEDKISN